jgi:hypothetical protein
MENARSIFLGVFATVSGFSLLLSALVGTAAETVKERTAPDRLSSASALSLVKPEEDTKVDAVAKPGSSQAESGAKKAKDPSVKELATGAKPAASAPLVPAADPNRLLRVHGWTETGAGSDGSRYGLVGVGVEKKVSDTVNLGVFLSVFSGKGYGWWNGYPMRSPDLAR